MTTEPVFSDLPSIRAAFIWPVERGTSLERVRKAMAVPRVVFPEQVHGTLVHVVEPRDPDAITGADGLVAARTRIALAGVGADCQVILAVDPVAKLIGVAHAGWRGILATMGSRFVEALVQAGARRDQLHLYVSPSVGPCHYAVKHNVFEQFQTTFGSETAFEQAGKYVLDLRAAQRQTLLDTGIDPAHLAIDSRCTVCAAEEFPSHRREGDVRTTNLVGCIMIAP